MNRFLSRKFLLAVVAGLVAFANSMWNFGLTTDQVWQVIAPLVGFILVEGARDYKVAK